MNNKSPENSIPKVREIEVDLLTPHDKVKRPIKRPSNKKKIILTSIGKRKPNINSPRIKANPNFKNIAELHNEELYLAVGCGVKISNQQRKSKLYSENRQYTWKTDDMHVRATGNFIKKITQRTNTKASNFSEFPQPIKEKQIKLNNMKPITLSKFRSRTVKRRNLASKLGRKKSPLKPNLKYYNIMTDLQKGKIRISPNKLC